MGKGERKEEKGTRKGREGKEGREKGEERGKKKEGRKESKRKKGEKRQRSSWKEKKGNGCFGSCFYLFIERKGRNWKMAEKKKKMEDLENCFKDGDVVISNLKEFESCFAESSDLCFPPSSPTKQKGKRKETSGEKTPGEKSPKKLRIRSPNKRKEQQGLPDDEYFRQLFSNFIQVSSQAWCIPNWDGRAIQVSFSFVSLIWAFCLLFERRKNRKPKTKTENENRKNVVEQPYDNHRDWDWNLLLLQPRKEVDLGFPGEIWESLMPSWKGVSAIEGVWNLFGGCMDSFQFYHFLCSIYKTTFSTGIWGWMHPCVRTTPCCCLPGRRKGGLCHQRQIPKAILQLCRVRHPQLFPYRKGERAPWRRGWGKEKGGDWETHPLFLLRKFASWPPNWSEREAGKPLRSGIEFLSHGKRDAHLRRGEMWLLGNSLPWARDPDLLQLEILFWEGCDLLLLAFIFFIFPSLPFPSLFVFLLKKRIKQNSQELYLWSMPSNSLGSPFPLSLSYWRRRVLYLSSPEAVSEGLWTRFTTFFLVEEKRCFLFA